MFLHIRVHDGSNWAIIFKSAALQKHSANTWPPTAKQEAKEEGTSTYGTSGPTGQLASSIGQGPGCS